MRSKHPFRAICSLVNVYCDLDIPCIDWSSIDVICNECLIHIDQSFSYNYIIHIKTQFSLGYFYLGLGLWPRHKILVNTGH